MSYEFRVMNYELRIPNFKKSMIFVKIRGSSKNNRIGDSCFSGSESKEILRKAMHCDVLSYTEVS